MVLLLFLIPHLPGEGLFLLSELLSPPPPRSSPSPLRPQPRAPDLSGHCRTWTASARSQWGIAQVLAVFLSDFNFLVFGYYIFLITWIQMHVSLLNTCSMHTWDQLRCFFFRFWGRNFAIPQCVTSHQQKLDEIPTGNEVFGPFEREKTIGKMMIRYQSLGYFVFRHSHVLRLKLGICDYVRWCSFITWIFFRTFRPCTVTRENLYPGVIPIRIRTGRCPQISWFIMVPRAAKSAVGVFGVAIVINPMHTWPWQNTTTLKIYILCTWHIYFYVCIYIFFL